jgi:hypothetical protein
MTKSFHNMFHKADQDDDRHPDRRMTCVILNVKGHGLQD